LEHAYFLALATPNLLEQIITLMRLPMNVPKVVGIGWVGEASRILEICTDVTSFAHMLHFA
jgi:hypothetical protein